MWLCCVEELRKLSIALKHGLKTTFKTIRQLLTSAVLSQSDRFRGIYYNSCSYCVLQVLFKMRAVMSTDALFQMSLNHILFMCCDNFYVTKVAFQSFLVIDQGFSLETGSLLPVIAISVFHRRNPSSSLCGCPIHDKY